MHIDNLGNGPDVVVLHATPAEPRDLLPLARRLAARFRVGVVHLPGYGLSAGDPPVSDLAAVRDAIVRDVRARGASSPLLVGFSAGGYRALSIACAGALDVKGLALFGGFACLADDHRGMLRGFAAEVRKGTDMRAAFADSSFSPDFRRLHPAEVERASRTALAAPAEVIAADLEAMAGSPDLRAELPRLSVPVIACVGSADAAVPPAYSEEIVSLVPGAKLELVPGRAHAIHEEDPDRVVAVIERLAGEAFPST